MQPAVRPAKQNTARKDRSSGSQEQVCHTIACQDKLWNSSPSHLSMAISRTVCVSQTNSKADLPHL